MSPIVPIKKLSIIFAGSVTCITSCMIASNNVVDAATITVVNRSVSPSSLPIPSNNFGGQGDRSFTISVTGRNDNLFPVQVDKISFDLLELDETAFEIFPNDSLGSFSKSITPVVVNPTNVNSFIVNFNVLNSTLQSNVSLGEKGDSTLGIDSLEFDITNIVLEGPAVPEPLTILGSGMALGFGALFKKEYSRKQKKVKSLEKQKA